MQPPTTTKQVSRALPNLTMNLQFLTKILSRFFAHENKLTNNLLCDNGKKKKKKKFLNENFFKMKNMMKKRRKKKKKKRRKFVKRYLII